MSRVSACAGPAHLAAPPLQLATPASQSLALVPRRSDGGHGPSAPPSLTFALASCCAAGARAALGRRRRGRASRAACARRGAAPRAPTACAARSESDSESEVHALAERTEQRPAEQSENVALEFKSRAADSLLQVGKQHSYAVTRWNDPRWIYRDVVQLFVKGGKGGEGCKSFRREAYHDMGGPNGGNGGHGGHVFLECVKNLANLRHFNDMPTWHGDPGVNGQGNALHGRNGDHTYVKVPPGTCVYVRRQWKEGAPIGKLTGKRDLIIYEDVVDRIFVGELTRPGQLMRVARGGRGGRGNRSFKTHNYVAPWLVEKGSPGVTRWIDLELKLVADVGIIGVPNAGKTSLINAVTAKLAKVAAYPFTTVEPNLGFYKENDCGGITLCDVPGLIEGASKGRGMGFKFLRHMERCKTLLHVVSANSEDPIGDFEVIQNELRQYSTELSLKPQVVIVNKIDVTEAREQLPGLLKELRKRCGHSRVFPISTASREGCKELMKRVYKWHSKIVEQELKEKETAMEDSAIIVNSNIRSQLGEDVGSVVSKPVITLDPLLPRGRNVKNAIQPRVEWDVLDEAWRLIHPKVEAVAASTKFEFEGHDRFNDVCRATGMTDALQAAGLQDGDPIICADYKFSFSRPEHGSESRLLIYEMDMRY